MPIFQRRIDKKILQAMQGSKAKRVLIKRAGELVEDAKRLLDQDIATDPVSIKIDSDPETIGFFGFNTTDLPVDNFQIYLSEAIQLDRNPIIKNRKKDKRYTFKIKFPTTNQIYGQSSLKLPWTRKTWVEGVEKGLSNVERFVFKPGKGRSEFGVLYKGEIRDRISPLIDPIYTRRIRSNFSNNLRRLGL